MVKVFLLLVCFPALVLIHELGHYGFALAFKIPLSAFVIGFGPRLISWKHRQTLYELRLWPFSAFVRWSNQPLAHPQILPNQAPWRQIVFFAGGAIANLSFALLLLWLHQGSLFPAIAELVALTRLFWHNLLFGGFTRFASESHTLSILEQIAFLSLGFGGINLLPIRGFDGSQILMSLWQAFKRRSTRR